MGRTCHNARESSSENPVRETAAPAQHELHSDARSHEGKVASSDQLKSFHGQVFLWNRLAAKGDGSQYPPMRIRTTTREWGWCVWCGEEENYFKFSKPVVRFETFPCFWNCGDYFEIEFARTPKTNAASLVSQRRFEIASFLPRI